MKFKTLQGREVNINLTSSRYPIRSREASRSHGQYHLGRQLKSIYNSSVILEEFGIPGSRLSLDFFIPNRSLAFEFQGIQHDEFNPFFHNSRKDFDSQKTRDSEKRQWCDLNKITLVEIRNQRISANDLKREINDQRSS